MPTSFYSFSPRALAAMGVGCLVILAAAVTVEHVEVIRLADDLVEAQASFVVAEHVAARPLPVPPPCPVIPPCPEPDETVCVAFCPAPLSLEPVVEARGAHGERGRGPREGAESDARLYLNFVTKRSASLFVPFNGQ